MRVAAILLGTILAYAMPEESDRKPNPEEPVREVIHGVVVEDPFRWLEDGTSERVKEWARRQDLHTEKILRSQRFYDQIRARLLELYEVESFRVPVPRAKRLFVMERKPSQLQSVLVMYDLESNQRTVLVDPNKLAADGTISIDWFYPSPDGRYVAYGLSEGGSERSTLHVIRCADGQLLPDSIPATRACSLAWLPDSSGFFYTRFPLPGSVEPKDENYYRRVYFHRLGTDYREDPLIFGADLPREEWPTISLSPNGRWLAVTVHQGWAKSEVYLADAKQTPPRFVPVARGEAAVFQAIALDDRILLHTNWQAPRYRVLAVDPSRPSLEKARVVVDETDDVLSDVDVAGQHLLLHYLHNVTSRLVLTNLDGQGSTILSLPEGVAVVGIGAHAASPVAYVGVQSFVRPTEVYQVDLRDPKPQLWRRVEVPFDPEAYRVKQVWFRSKDGTLVPMFLVHRRGLKKGRHVPTLLYGYGGFSISITPRFWNWLPVWLDAGGLFAVANIRGGAEFGEEWHRAGMLDKKQNVFDDFIAAAEWLINEGYTSPHKLAIMGRSNGGLLVAAVMTQRPELFRAVVCGVPLTDMVRYHRFLIARLWIPEYGDPDRPEDFRWLYAYSPYHRVRPGVEYPAVLITTAELDTRVDPAHARKFAARLQNATASKRPVLLRFEDRAGHGVGKPVSKIVDEYADVLTFLFWQLEVKPDAAAASPGK